MNHRVRLIFLFLVIPLTKSLSQTNEERFYTTTDTLTTIHELINFRSSNLHLVKGVEEHLNFGVTQTSWTLSRERKSLKTHLLTLSVNGKIFYREYYLAKFNDDLGRYAIDKLHVSSDSSLMMKVNEVSEANYGRIINLKHIERQPNRSIFGYGCSYSGSMPHEGLKMLKLVEDKNVDELSEWLVSINPIKQAYSCIGLKLLESRGVLELSSSMLKTMEALGESSTLIYCCSGCTSWEYLPMRVFMNAETVNSFIAIKK